MPLPRLPPDDNDFIMKMKKVSDTGLIWMEVFVKIVLNIEKD
jgi:hypothetical protein